MKVKNKFLGLQFFNEPEPPTPPPVEPPSEPQGLTPEQVNKIIQDRIAKEQAKWQKKIEEEKAEATRLATLDADQRKQAEFEKKLKDLEERDAALKLKESKVETANVLKGRGLAETFVDFVIGADNETTLERINALEKAFKDAVKAEVDTRLPGATPPAGGNNTPTGNKEVTKEEFKKLPLHKQNELYVKDPEKYKQLFK